MCAGAGVHLSPARMERRGLLEPGRQRLRVERHGGRTEREGDGADRRNDDQFCTQHGTSLDIAARGMRAVRGFVAPTARYVHGMAGFNSPARPRRCGVAPAVMTNNQAQQRSGFRSWPREPHGRRLCKLYRVGRRGRHRPKKLHAEVSRSRSGECTRSVGRFGRGRLSGGGSGIRTHDTVSRIHAFQASAFSHSAIPPRVAAGAI
jgi:hypothetical protein